MACLFDTNNHIRLDPGLKYSLFTVNNLFFVCHSDSKVIRMLRHKVKACVNKNRSCHSRHFRPVVVMIVLLLISTKAKSQQEEVLHRLEEEL